MQILRFAFGMLMFSGCWRPFSWTSPFKRIIYNFYSITIMCLMITFVISEFINIMLNLDSPDEFTASAYMMLTVFMGFYKLLNICLNRKEIKETVKNLTENSFAPSDSREVQFLRKYDRAARNAAMSYVILCEFTVACIIVTSLFTDYRKGNLPYNAWIPFNYTAADTFTGVTIYQLSSVTTCSLTNTANDSLICGLLLHVCCQLEFLEYRLTKISRGRHVLRDCVRHHDRVFELARMVNGQFVKVIAFQFATSMLVMCSNLYRLAKDPQDVSLILYTACILSQIFIYCWFGNEIKLKSLHVIESIYHMKWLALNDSSKKDLLLIMKRSKSPIEFTSAVIISLDLDSFVSVLKAAYSAFNLLRTRKNI